MKPLFALLLALTGCRHHAPSPPDLAELKQIDDELATMGRRGTSAGALLERRGQALEHAGHTDEAISAYEEAAAAYEQSPEGNSLPPLRAAHARERAEKLRRLKR